MRGAWVGIALALVLGDARRQRTREQQPRAWKLKTMLHAGSNPQVIINSADRT